ncbi:MAG TPA: aminotransferase class I/II-fold pyridoxal phosphate-dependent enzyme, partial [Polyangiaceae bacterium]|nr:aminotransferase class I/II-fold pyridoxal phosphate-dependent enzyme [Polyangiaceae bacterium]
GRHMLLRGQSLVNFGSCSYLGLEVDERLKDSACDAIRRYGVQFSSSRAYVSTPLYGQFEDLLERVLGAPVVVTQTTSLGHLATLPVVVGEHDVVLFDVLVHASVQAVLPTLRAAGTQCNPVPHNRVDRLAELVDQLERRYDKIWYLCDGIYSMHGDRAPLAELFALQARHAALHLYIDDAHGMSWTGRNGAGTVLGAHGIPERTVVALGLSKAFAAAGAAFVFSDAESRRLVRSCGSTLIFSGPLQPGQLGAGIASARLHLTNECGERQALLRKRIALFNELSDDCGMLLRDSSESPIRFIEVGPEERALELANALVEAGFFANLSVFPAVPRRRAGIRVMLTTHHTEDDLVELTHALMKAASRSGNRISEIR